MGPHLCFAFFSPLSNASPSMYLAASGSINTYLDKWTAWWSSNNNGDSSADAAHLLSNTDRSSSTTGLAWVGTLCRAGYSSGVNEDKALWQYTVETVAHELGHNFGAGHDSLGSAVSCPQVRRQRQQQEKRSSSSSSSSSSSPPLKLRMSSPCTLCFTLLSCFLFPVSRG